jgi:GxxExxY protein
MEVHRELGCGFLEAVYQEALAREFESQGIPNESQPLVKIYYKGNPLNKTYQPDFVCFNEVIVEIKALNQLAPQDHAQIINYLKASDIRTGLLLNFGAKSLEYKRFIYKQK